MCSLFCFSFSINMYGLWVPPNAHTALDKRVPSPCIGCSLKAKENFDDNQCRTKYEPCFLHLCLSYYKANQKLHLRERGVVFKHHWTGYCSQPWNNLTQESIICFLPICLPILLHNRLLGLVHACSSAQALFGTCASWHQSKHWWADGNSKPCDFLFLPTSLNS